MNTLHTLNASARERADLLARLLRSASAGDSLLLIENGVYNLSDSATLATIDAAALRLHVLAADLAARGLQLPTSNAIVVDDAGFVALACSHGKVVSWFD